MRGRPGEEAGLGDAGLSHLASAPRQSRRNYRLAARSIFEPHVILVQKWSGISTKRNLYSISCICNANTFPGFLSHGSRAKLDVSLEKETKFSSILGFPSGSSEMGGIVRNQKICKNDFSIFLKLSAALFQISHCVWRCLNPIVPQMHHQWSNIFNWPFVGRNERSLTT